MKKKGFAKFSKVSNSIVIVRYEVQTKNVQEGT